MSYASFNLMGSYSINAQSLGWVPHTSIIDYAVEISSDGRGANLKAITKIMVTIHRPPVNILAQQHSKGSTPTIPSREWMLEACCLHWSPRRQSLFSAASSKYRTQEPRQTICQSPPAMEVSNSHIHRNMFPWWLRISFDPVYSILSLTF